MTKLEKVLKRKATMCSYLADEMRESGDDTLAQQYNGMSVAYLYACYLVRDKKQLDYEYRLLTSEEYEENNND